jgi:hypothetical protein
MVASINEGSLKMPVAVKFRYEPLHPMSSAVILLGIVNGIPHNVFTDRHRCLHFGLDLVCSVPEGESATKRKTCE